MHFCRRINFACYWQDLKEDLVQDMVACLSNQLKIRCIHELPAHLLRQKIHVAYNRRSQQMLACASPSKRRLRHKQQHCNNETYVYTHSINGCCHPPTPTHTHKHKVDTRQHVDCTSSFSTYHGAHISGTKKYCST